MARYLERAENQARLLDVSLTMALIDVPEDREEQLSVPLLVNGSLDIFMELTGKPLALNDSVFPTQVLLRFTRLTEPDAELKAFAGHQSALITSPAHSAPDGRQGDGPGASETYAQLH